jgi:hypothetical protein
LLADKSERDLRLNGTAGSDVPNQYGANIVVHEVARVHFRLGPEVQDGGTAEGGYTIASVYHVTCLQQLLIVPQIMSFGDDGEEVDQKSIKPHACTGTA